MRHVELVITEEFKGKIIRGTHVMNVGSFFEGSVERPVEALAEAYRNINEALDRYKEEHK